MAGLDRLTDGAFEKDGLSPGTEGRWCGWCGHQTRGPAAPLPDGVIWANGLVPRACLLLCGMPCPCDRLGTSPEPQWLKGTRTGPSVTGLVHPPGPREPGHQKPCPLEGPTPTFKCSGPECAHEALHFIFCGDTVCQSTRRYVATQEPAICARVTSTPRRCLLASQQGEPGSEGISPSGVTLRARPGSATCQECDLEQVWQGLCHPGQGPWQPLMGAIAPLQASWASLLTVRSQWQGGG